MMFDIYIEGHSATGSSSEAQLIKANVAGDTFEDACISFSKTEDAKGWGNFDSERLTFWGCGLFDNMSDASK